MNIPRIIPGSQTPDVVTTRPYKVNDQKFRFNQGRKYSGNKEVKNSFRLSGLKTEILQRRF